ncbi:hypothetical protein M514_23857 [Trichuris suis]|uniref:Integrase catalytic domain-containing protein n=1 Tax=Trichuris suis TaxID=68888 RepID=A0A085N3G3_9BILA|nr:hypothetical protein M514_23857 [Trichuris suis]
MNSHEDNSSVLLTPDSILAFGLSPHGLHCLDLLRRRLTDERSYSADSLSQPPGDPREYIFTIVDRYTRYPEAIPLKDATATECARALLSWISRFGICLRLTSDRGRQFISDVWRELCQLLGIQSHTTLAYEPHQNGLVERMHRDLKASLMATLQGDPNWADTLPIILMGMRAAFKPDIGTSAAELVLGETLRLPGQYFDRTPHVHLPLVIISHSRLCQGRFPQNSAPATLQYRVLERGPKSYLLELEAGVDSVSIDRLKPAFLAPGQPEATGPPISVETPETASDASRPQPCPVATRSGRLPRTPARFSDCLPFCQSQI